MAKQIFEFENVKCDNCGLVIHKNNAEKIVNLAARLEPGGIVPAGECPYCEALMYPTLEKVKKIKLRLTVDVVYVPNGESVVTLKSMLTDMVYRASEDGMMTPESSKAEVETWSRKVIEVKQ